MNHISAMLFTLNYELKYTELKQDMKMGAIFHLEEVSCLEGTWAEAKLEGGGGGLLGKGTLGGRPLCSRGVCRERWW